MEIHITERHGMWVKGHIQDQADSYRFSAKLAVAFSTYGIGGGKVIKLAVHKENPNGQDQMILSYDRGWDIPLMTKGLNHLIVVLTGFLNNLPDEGQNEVNKPILLDGKATAKEIKDTIKANIEGAKQERAPKLAVILIGDDPASKVYVRNKEKDCQECGILCDTYSLVESTDEETLLDMIDNLNMDNSVDGILVQLPLPKHISTDRVVRRIDPDKDVDGFCPVNVGLTHMGKTEGFAPCTPAGVMALLKKYEIPVAGKNVVVIGRSNTVGRPMAEMLLQADATVTVCHSKTENLAAICRQADILISAVGKAGLVQSDMIAPNAVIIDVGMNRNEDGKLCGDVDLADKTTLEKVSAYTPVPGGVGPMTRAILMENTWKAWRKHNKSEGGIVMQEMLQKAIEAMIAKDMIQFRPFSWMSNIVDVTITSEIFEDDPSFVLSIKEDEWEGGPGKAVAAELVDALKEGTIKFIPYVDKTF